MHETVGVVCGVLRRGCSKNDIWITSYYYFTLVYFFFIFFACLQSMGALFYYDPSHFFLNRAPRLEEKNTHLKRCKTGLKPKSNRHWNACVCDCVLLGLFSCVFFFFHGCCRAGWAFRGKNRRMDTAEGGRRRGRGVLRRIYVQPARRSAVILTLLMTDCGSSSPACAAYSCFF